MPKGPLIGKGMTAEVYEWGTSQVLKLYYDWFQPERIRAEADIGRAVKKAGVSAPVVFDMVEDGNRVGLVYERVFGRTMLREMQSSPLKIMQYARELARLHSDIHRCRSTELPRQKDRLEQAIRSSSELLKENTEIICKRLHALPEGAWVCHGDFHPDNIIMAGSGKVAIDWTNAASGDPMCDAARTCLILRSPFIPPGTPKIMILPINLTKKLLHSMYLKEYCKLAEAEPSDIEAWMLPLAAARLRENVPGERKWLLELIRKRLQGAGIGR